ncbi:MAG: iron-sulfur cluster assembly protein [Alphaproteobacteria bacterium]
MTPELKDKIIAQIQTIYDPDVSVNIWDLGLIYDIRAEGKIVHVDMTLTSPTCPVGDTLMKFVDNKTRAVLPEAYENVIVNLVWEPPWSKEKMSEAALLELGLF